MNPQRLITINWTAVTDLNAIGYNVYIVNGALPNATKTFIAFVNGVNSIGFNYTITEGQQYQFEVRATENGTIDETSPQGPESGALEIVWPNGTGYATPTTLTPTGAPMMVPRDSQYVWPYEFNQYSTGLQFADTDPIVTSGVLNSYLKAASGAVNRYCKRYFQVQTLDEIYPGVTIGQSTYPKLMTVFLKQKPVQSIISINLQVLKYFIPVDLEYLMLDSDAGYYNIVPALGGGYTGYPVPQMVEGMLARVWTRYTAGFDILPEEIKIATVMIATKMIALPSQNPSSAQNMKLGRNYSVQWSTPDTDPIMDMVKDLLGPYRKFAWGKPSLQF